MKFFIQVILKSVIILNFGSFTCYGMHKWIDPNYSKSYTSPTISDPNIKQTIIGTSQKNNISKKKGQDNSYYEY